MLFEKDTRLVMMGDSVTDCGRARPIGEMRQDGTGSGYPTMVDACLTTKYPHLNIRVTNMGVGGNKIRDLKERWQTDVLDLKPDYVSVMIGINDVWRQYDMPMAKENHVYLEEYVKTYKELIEKTKPLVKQMILMTPYYMEPNLDDAMRRTMDVYGEAVRSLAKQYDTVFVDTQKGFDEIFKHMHPNAIAWDRVHPNAVGHMVITNAFLEAVGY